MSLPGGKTTVREKQYSTMRVHMFQKCCMRLKHDTSHFTPRVWTFTVTLCLLFLQQHGHTCVGGGRRRQTQSTEVLVTCSIIYSKDKSTSTPLRKRHTVLNLLLLVKKKDKYLCYRDLMN